MTCLVILILAFIFRGALWSILAALFSIIIRLGVFGFILLAVIMLVLGRD